MFDNDDIVFLVSDDFADHFGYLYSLVDIQLGRWFVEHEDTRISHGCKTNGEAL